MPDWSYQTLFRPALFRLPVQVARDWTLAVMGGLVALPLGEGPALAERWAATG